MTFPRQRADALSRDVSGRRSACRWPAARWRPGPGRWSRSRSATSPTDRHRTVDDTPAGGGAGMVMRADILAKAIDHAAPADDPRPAPADEPARQAADAGEGARTGRRARRGHRLRALRRRRPAGDRGARSSRKSRSATTSCPAASRRRWCCSTRSCGCCPASWATSCPATHESFEDGLLEYPHYTRPQEFEGRDDPRCAHLRQPRQDRRMAA